MNSESPGENAPSDEDQSNVEPYIKNTNEWVARCRARLLQLDSALRVEDADALVWGMVQLQRWRSMSPESVADKLHRGEGRRRASGKAS
jgi:hypothetical protein